MLTKEVVPEPGSLFSNRIFFKFGKVVFSTRLLNYLIIKLKKMTKIIRVEKL